MRKYIKACLLISLSVTALIACSSNPAEMLPATSQNTNIFPSGYASSSYTKIDEIACLPQIAQFDKAVVLGISPDEEYLVTGSQRAINLYDFNKLLSVKSEPKPYDSYQVEPPPPLNVAGKSAMWAKGNKSAFLLVDSFHTCYELESWPSNVNVYSASNRRLALQFATDEPISKNWKYKGSLILSPSFSSDGKSVVYCDWADKCTFLYKVDISSGKKETLFTSDKFDVIECIELSANVYLCLNKAKNAKSELFLIDGKNSVIKRMEDKAMGFDDIENRYDIKAWSDNRKTVLITKETMHADKAANTTTYSFPAFYVFQFKDNYTDYNLLQLDVSKGNNGEQTHRELMDVALSPDGKFAVSSEFHLKPRKNELVLYSFFDEKKAVLYSSDSESEWVGRTNLYDATRSEGLFITKNGKLLVCFLGPDKQEFKLFQLK